jgi:asparagine synthetase B (glutamine-hydrolysing)
MDRADAPEARGRMNASDAWVLHYAPSRPVSLVGRETARSDRCSAAIVGDLDVFVDGTIFDLASLAAEFNLAPQVAAIPARVILEAYRRSGEQCLDRVNGRCVVLVNDRSTRRLLAARDRMGVCPLFYAAIGDGVLFSPSIEALLAQPEVSRAVSRVVLAEHLMHRWVDPNETYFAAVRRVPPGHVVRVQDGHLALSRYWNPSTDHAVSDDEALDQFDAVFERAVERCMGQHRTAIFLSGGFDSVSVAAAATAVARRDGRLDPRALSLGFDDPDCDEQFVQRSVAHSLGVPQDLVPFDQAVNGRGLLMPALEMGATWPVPLLNIWTPAYCALAQRARPHGCDTILTGTGGDEWLNVTPFLAADLIRQREVRALARLVGVFARSFRLTRLQVLRTALWTFGLRPLAGEVLDHVAPRQWQARRQRKLVQATHAWIAPDPSLRKEMDDRTERLMQPSRPGPGGYYERELQLALAHPLVSIEYEEHAEFSRRVGASVLHPYLDADLVTLLYRMSPAALTTGGRTKSLVRAAVARRFPTLGFERQRKVSATNFFQTVMRREAPAAWQTLGGTRTLSDLGVVQPARLAAVATDLFAGRHRPERDYSIWCVLNLESWVRGRARPS